MPYLKPEDKTYIDKGGLPTTSGQLNYAITMLLLRFVGDAHSYKDLNDVMGAIESAKLEFYRRVVVPYEQAKLETNGDVYKS